MAVDYDGSKTAFDSSANYNAQEFANDVIYTIKQVCDDENVPHPTIIQESGRFLSAYHAILVTNVLEEIETVVEDITPIEIDEDDPQVVIELGDLRETITVKNYREFYHDALEHRDELFTLFNLGLISLEDRAKGRSEEHTSELQSPCNLVCRLLLEKKKKQSIVHSLSLNPLTPLTIRITKIPAIIDHFFPLPPIRLDYLYFKYTSYTRCCIRFNHFSH